MGEGMQVGLFFQRAQTIRKLLAGEVGWLEDRGIDGWDPPGQLPAGCRSIKDKTQMSATSGLVTELERIATALSAEEGAASEFSLTTVAEKIAKNLSVRKDEVAIMGVSTRWRHLHFLVPEALKNVGFIPLSSNSALAARTARDSRPEIENNFITTRHANVFEGVKINSETAESIQKIISAPILAEGKVIGVIQISRKGATAKSAGPDFTADDLGKLLAVCKPLGKLLRHVSSE
jgi:hypothetical protein